MRYGAIFKNLIGGFKGALRQQVDVDVKADASGAVLLAAAKDGDIGGLRGLDEYLARCTVEDAPNLRAMLNPLGRAGFAAFQVMIWGQLIKFTPPSHESLGRMLRLVVATLGADDQMNGADTKSLKAAVESILDRTLELPDVADAVWHAPLIQAASGLDPLVQTERSARIIGLLAPVLSVESALRMYSVQPLFNNHWVSAFHVEMMRVQRLEEAELLGTALSEAGPARDRYFLRRLTAKVRSGAFAGVIGDLRSARGEALSVQKIAEILKDVPEPILLKSVFGDLRAGHALRIFLAAVHAGKSEALEQSVVGMLGARPPAGLARHALEIYQDEAGRAEDIDWSSLLASLDGLVEGLGTALERWVATSADYVVRAKAGEALVEYVGETWPGNASALAGLTRAVSLAGVYPVEALDSVEPPVRSNVAERAVKETQLLLTLAALDPALEELLGKKGIDYEELRVGLPSKEEREAGPPTTVTDVGYGLNSAEAHASARLVVELARVMTEGMVGEVPGKGSFEEEVVRPLVEDRIFPSVNLAMKLYEHLKLRKTDRITVVIDDVHYINGMQVACFLKLKGFENVLVLFNVKKGAALRSLRDAWASGAGRLDQVVLHLASGVLGAERPAALDVGRWLPSLVGRENANGLEAAQGDRGSGKPRVLMMTSLRDGSYFISATALFKRLSKNVDLTIYNGSASGDDKFLDLTNFDEDRLIRCLYSDGDLQQVMKASVLRMFDSLRSNWSGSQVDIFLASSAVQMARSIPAALANEIAQAELFQGMMENGKVDILVTIPGRMTSARSGTLIARTLGIPTLDLQALLISSHPRYYASEADVYGGLTEDQLDIYRAKSPPKHQTLVRIGSLMIGEQLSRVKDLSVEQARAEFNLSADRSVIIYGAQYGQGAEGDEIIRMMVRAANAIENSLLIVKLHPRTLAVAIEGIREMVKAEATGDVRVEHEGDVYAMMRAADLVVTQFSNVGLEAAVMGRPVLSINLTGADYAVDLPRLGVAERASTEQEVLDKVRALLKDDDARAALGRSRDAYFNRNPELRDLSAADTVAQLVKDILEKSAVRAGRPTVSKPRETESGQLST